MSSGGSRVRVDPIKVVIINTRYVETDAMSFKSVVQSLTGKDSKIEMETSTAAAGFKEDNPILFHSGVQISYNPAVPVMSRGMSFKDLDKLLRDMPPLEELYNLWAD